MRTHQLVSLQTALVILLSGLLAGCSTAPPEAEGVRVIPDELVSGEPTPVKIYISAGPEGIPVGGTARIFHYSKPWFGFARGLINEGGDNTLVSASRSDGGELITRMIQRDRIAFAGRSHFDFEIAGTPLPPGGKILVDYGSEGHLIAAGRKQREFLIEAGIDRDGDGSFQMIEAQPLRILENDPVKLRIVGPSQTAVGEPTDFVIFAEDHFGNLCENYGATLEVETSGNEGAEDYAVHPLNQEKLLDRHAITRSFSTTGIHTVSVRDPATGMRATSNPVVVTVKPAREKIFWGDLHVHTAISDGQGELRDVYRDAYARGHDFLAITDHHFGRELRGSLRERLEIIAENAKRYTVPGEFIAIPAGETHFLKRTHMNLYFDKIDANVMERLVERIKAAKTKVAKWKDASSEEFREAGDRYWEAFDTEEFKRFPLAFSHHTLWMGVKEYIHDERQRLIEIYSFHGSSEVLPFDETPPLLRGHLPQAAARPGPKYSVREVLDDGHHLGIVGGSDDHFGQAGSAALTGVVMDNLSLSSLLEALYKRHCYAVSGHRTIVDFSLNGKTMGQTLSAARELDFRADVVADGKIHALQIIGKGGLLYETHPNGAQQASLAWSRKASKGYYYLRVLLESGNAAWSSPIWVD